MRALGVTECECLLVPKFPWTLQKFSHVALDGEDLRAKLLDAHVEVRDLGAAALEAVPELSRAGGSLLKLKGWQGDGKDGVL